MTITLDAISHVHEVLCEYKQAEEHFIEVEAKYLASDFRKPLQPEYDKALEVWFSLGDEAFALASFITDNAISEDWFKRLMNFRLDEIISMTA